MFRMPLLVGLRRRMRTIALICALVLLVQTAEARFGNSKQSRRLDEATLRVHSRDMTLFLLLLKKNIASVFNFFFLNSFGHFGASIGSIGMPVCIERNTTCEIRVPILQKCGYISTSRIMVNSNLKNIRIQILRQ